MENKGATEFRVSEKKRSLEGKANSSEGRAPSDRNNSQALTIIKTLQCDHLIRHPQVPALGIKPRQLDSEHVE